MVVFDTQNQKLFELNSQPDFDLKVVDHMLDKVNRQQFQNNFYTNEDYHKFDLNKNDDQDSTGDQSDALDQYSTRKRISKNYKKEQSLHLSKLK